MTIWLDFFLCCDNDVISNFYFLFEQYMVSILKNNFYYIINNII